MKRNFLILEDKTIIDIDGKVIFFSIERFIQDIAKDGCCFICGAKPSEKDFNDEHVIPNWILKKFKLQNKSIKLPNKSNIQYSQYKVPCCSECNSFLGDNIEKTMSKVVSKGYDSFLDFLKNDGYWLVFKWLSLIFVKVHLKDKFFRLNLDSREPDYKISELYDWESLHHIHCIARSLYTNCLIDKEVFSSFFVFQVENDNELEQFDYGDIYHGKGILIRLGEICILAVLNDSGGAATLYEDELKKINGKLSQLQYREILAHLSYININLKNRPKYYTTYDFDQGFIIKADLPDLVEFEVNEELKFGDYLYSSCYDILERLQNPEKEMIISKVKDGLWTFLFDKDGNFIKNDIPLS